MGYIQKLVEAKSRNEANMILDKLDASTAVRKLVEVSFVTRKSPDQNTRKYGMGCLKEAADSLKKDKEDKEMKEEILSNHNSTSRSAGSEQSTSNTGLPMEGKQEGDEDMENAPDTENQMTEIGPADILKEMEDDDDDDMEKNKKMKDHVKEALRPYIAHMKKQDEAIRKLSELIRETKQAPLVMDAPTSQLIASPVIQETSSKKLSEFETSQARAEISHMNNSLAEELR